MDLMEYQAKELFAKHGVTTTLGVVVDHRRRGQAAAEQLGGVTVVKAQVKAGGRGKAGGVKLAKTPDEAFEHALEHPRDGDQGPHGQPGPGHPGDAPGGGVLLLLPARPRQPSHLCIASVEGGVEIEEVAKTNPDAVAADPDRPRHRRRRRRRPPRSSTRPSSRPSCATRPSRWSRRCGRSSSTRTRPWSRSTRWPALRATSSRPWTARSRSTTTPSSATRTTRRSRSARRPTRSRRRPRTRASTTSSSTVPVGIIGNGAGLVMSHPRRGRLRRRDSTAASSRPTSSTSVAAPTPR